MSQANLLTIVSQGRQYILLNNIIEIYCPEQHHFDGFNLLLVLP